MKQLLTCAAIMLGWFAVQAGSGAAVAQEQSKATSTSQGAAEATKSGIADGASSPDEMGNRRPLYRLQKSDVLEIKFNFASEFDQTLSIQPDGFITPRGLDELYAEGLTVAELRGAIKPGLCRHAARSGSHDHAQGFRKALFHRRRSGGSSREDTNYAATRP